MDETQPLLVPVPPLTITAGQHAYIADVNIAHDDSFDHRIDFNPNGDPENPLEWPKAYHNGVISLLACMAFTVYLSQNPHFTQKIQFLTPPTEHSPASA